MRKYILDTNAILQRPELLGRSLPAGSLVVPAAVMQEFGGRIRRSGNSKLFALVVDAERSGVLTIENVDVADVSHTVEIDRLSFGDMALLAHARRIKAGGDVPVVVTTDRDVIAAGMKAGFEVLTPKEVLDELDRRPLSVASIAAPLETRANEAAIESRRTPRILVLSGVLIGLIAVLLIANIAYLLETIPTWGTLSGLVILAFSLYWIRGRWRLPYGVAEFIVGLTSSWIGARAQIGAVSLSPVVIFQVLGGLYVMVRGLDNVGRGILATRYGEYWDRTFGEQ